MRPGRLAKFVKGQIRSIDRLWWGLLPGLKLCVTMSANGLDVVWEWWWSGGMLNLVGIGTGDREEFAFESRAQWIGSWSVNDLKTRIERKKRTGSFGSWSGSGIHLPHFRS